MVEKILIKGKEGNELWRIQLLLELGGPFSSLMWSLSRRVRLVVVGFPSSWFGPRLESEKERKRRGERLFSKRGII